MPACLHACLPTGWTCHRNQPLQSQTQNRDTIDSSSTPYMLVSRRTARHALTKSLKNNFQKTKPWRFPADFCPRLFVVRFFFSRFPINCLVYFLSLGPLWDNLVSSPEFDRDLNLHFGILLDHFSTSLPMLFSRIFRFVPKQLCSQLSWKMHAFGGQRAAQETSFPMF